MPTGLKLRIGHSPTGLVPKEREGKKKGIGEEDPQKKKNHEDPLGTLGKIDMCAETDKPGVSPRNR